MRTNRSAYAVLLAALGLWAAGCALKREAPPPAVDSSKPDRDGDGIQDSVDVLEHEDRREADPAPRNPGPKPTVDVASTSTGVKDLNRNKVSGARTLEGLAQLPAGENADVEGRGRRDPNGPIPDMFFKRFGVNPTIETTEESVSTFAADVDTASFTLARSYLARGAMPDEDAIRVEEFVNAFDYGYRPPEREAFAVSVEAFPSPNRKGYHVLHVGLKGKEVKPAQRKSANLVFAIDVSGSMSQENRLGLVKRALAMLVGQLQERDSVGIVVYGSTAHTVLEPTSAENKDRILAAIDALQPEGSTNVQAGLLLAYKVAAKGMRQGGINRVILCSDGVANNGITQADAIFATVKKEAELGVTVSTVGFGMGNYNDALMERLADTGNGNYAYVDRLDEAKRIFVENLTGTLQVIAKDVKIQLEFDKEAVVRYRLVGFENRMLTKEQFADDKIDAGELGAGHAVTAIYEVKFKTLAKPAFASLRIRYKEPDGRTSALVEKALPSEIVRDAYAKTTGPTRVSMVAAAFAEKLRGSYWVRNLSYDDLLKMWDQIPDPLRQRRDVGELREMVQKARSLDTRPDRFERDMPLAMMDFDRIPVLK